MIVVDASALVAIGLGEPEQGKFLDRLARAQIAYLAPINYVEVGVIMRRLGLVEDQDEMDTWLASLSVELKDDVALGSAALAAYFRYGKGFHRARLNLADCFAYALARQLGAPLLYKGDDFSQTDIRSAS